MIPESQKRLRLAGMCVLAVLPLLFFGLIRTNNLSEPNYHGLSLRDWIERHAKGDPKSAETIQAIGTNAIPILLQWLNSKDTRISTLRYAIYSKMPLSREPFTPFYKRALACQGFAALGDKALPAVPELRRLLYNTNTSRAAAIALAGIGNVGEAILIDGLGVPIDDVRIASAMATVYLEAPSRSLVTALVRTTDDEEWVVRWASVNSLSEVRCFDCEAEIKAALNRKLRDNTALVRQVAFQAIAKRFPSSDEGPDRIRLDNSF